MGGGRKVEEYEKEHVQHTTYAYMTIHLCNMHHTM